MARVAASGRIASTRTNSVLFNGDFELAPSSFTAQTQTNNRWIDGTSGGSNQRRAFGWGLITGGTSGRASFDNTISHSGTYSIKLSATTTGATVVAGSYKTATPLREELFLLPANTAITITFWIKTSNAVSSAAFLDLREYSSAVATITTTSSSKFSGTNDWTQSSFSVTTGASTVYGSLLLRNNIAGNISDVWFDDITVVPATIGRTAASGRVAP